MFYWCDAISNSVLGLAVVQMTSSVEIPSSIENEIHPASSSTNHTCIESNIATLVANYTFECNLRGLSDNFKWYCVLLLFLGLLLY